MYEDEHYERRMTMKKNLLVSYMARYGENQVKLAEALGMSAGSLSLRFRGVRRFTDSEIAFIMNRYQIPPDDIVEIFLS